MRIIPRQHIAPSHARRLRRVAPSMVDFRGVFSVHVGYELSPTQHWTFDKACVACPPLSYCVIEGVGRLQAGRHLAKGKMS